MAASDFCPSSTYISIPPVKREKKERKESEKNLTMKFSLKKVKPTIPIFCKNRISEK